MKKYLLLCLIGCGLVFAANAQPCSFGTAKAEIHPNNIRAAINQGGKLFSDNFDPGYFPTTPSGDNDIPTIFGAALWMGGVDAAGNLKITASGYSPGFFAGPLDPNTGATTAGDCNNWNKVFAVKGSQIADFLAELQAGTQPSTATYANIYGWPGRDNPHFESVHGFALPQTNSGLAPFFDADADGVYNPLQGDYPVVALRGKPLFVPAEIAWCVYNDQGAGSPSLIGGNNLRVEIQQTAWGFNCTDQPVLNNTVFTSHKIINRAFEDTDSLSIGIWTDFDLGCYTDDYLGSSPAHQCIFAYNQDAVDGSVGSACNGGGKSFGSNVPVQTTIFLGNTLDKFMAPTNGQFGNPAPATTDPQSPFDYFQYLNGHWRDGTPLTVGGVGYDPQGGTLADYAFPSDPNDPNGWSMCTANIPFGDRQALASHLIGKIQPGQVEEFNTAYMTFWPAADYLPCSLGGAMTAVDEVHQIFDTDFAETCTPFLTAAPDSQSADKTVKILPNPNDGSFKVAFGDLKVTFLQILSTDGRIVAQYTPSGSFADIQLGTAAAGIYWVRLFANEGVVTRKVVVGE